MKTPEEIKQSVLKECERLCPNIGKQHWITDDVLVERSSPDHWEFRGRGEQYGLFSIRNGAINAQWKVEMAYRLFGLEARELEEKYNDLLKLSNQIQEKADTLEERAQGLVEMAEYCADLFKGRNLGDMASKALNQWKGGQHV